MSGKISTAFIRVNDAMPGLARFETNTKDDIASRPKSINRTELPVPFRMFFAAQVIDCDFLARSMRFLFADHCVGGDSRFYKIAPEILRAAVEPSAIAIPGYSDGELGISPAMGAQMEPMRPFPGKPGAVDHIVPSPSNVDPAITAKEMVRETAESSPIMFVRNHKA